MTRMSVIAMGAVIAAAAAIGACGSSTSPVIDANLPDAPVDGLSASCQATIDEYTALAETLDDSCTTVADCVLLGGTIDGSPTCDCVAFLTNPCEGIAVARDAITPAIQSDLNALRAQFVDICADVDDVWTCDCAPQNLSCSPNGHCVLGWDQLCFPAPDASLADAGLADAGLADAVP